MVLILRANKASRVASLMTQEYQRKQVEAHNSSGQQIDASLNLYA